MKTSTIASLVAIVVIVGAAAALHWWPMPPIPAPSDTAGVNGSPDQGAVGQGNTNGSPQPGVDNGVGDASAPGDGTPLSDNLILGINSSAALGSYLTAYNGMTLYTYSPDTPGVSKCTDACAANWPPYTVASSDRINVAANIGGKVSTITRADGTLQIAYNGMPVYFYVEDAKPNDTSGQGVGGVWFVVKP